MRDQAAVAATEERVHMQLRVPVTDLRHHNHQATLELFATHGSAISLLIPASLRQEP